MKAMEKRAMSAKYLVAAVLPSGTSSQGVLDWFMRFGSLSAVRAGQMVTFPLGKVERCSRREHVHVHLVVSSDFARIGDTLRSAAMDTGATHFSIVSFDPEKWCAVEKMGLLDGERLMLSPGGLVDEEVEA